MALSKLAFWLIGFETRGRTIDEIDREMNALETRRSEVVVAVCGILGAVLSVAVEPFAPLAMLISVGFTSIAPTFGGVLMLACAAGVLYLAVTTGGVVVVVLGLITVALSVTAGIASLVTGRAKPSPVQGLAHDTANVPAQ